MAHQVIFTAICTFVTQFVWSAFISALEAPTATSSASYRFWFKFLNNLAANLQRAKSTAVESSPNFQAALNKQLDQVGLPRVDAMVPPGPDVKT